MAKTALQTGDKADDRPLATRIADVEQRILDRRQAASIRKVYLEERMRNQLTSPAVLLLAGGIGFVVGELLRGNQDHLDPRIPHTDSSFVRVRNQLLDWAQPLFMAELGKVMQSASSVASVQLADHLTRLFNHRAGTPS